ncbi:hypothetical protein GCM10007939_09300 [Amylibacter marinus]|uniref:DUF3572 family protein n=1 Tax=Amylibacter marinus TaxID=1475483 RepID=A0ABQ5VT77_9RHOB|nr:DUF3572 domain-containing protein [Amylibacter marinus]GLQ34647.1 hypothetical protein GCM10007939_09300 [Amylibacter marinus]
MISKEQADVVALKALEWLAGHEDLLMTFLGATGANLGDIKDNARDSMFLGSVLDFILMDDDWVREFSDAHGYKYDMVYHVRQALPGGEIPNWT